MDGVGVDSGQLFDDDGHLGDQLGERNATIGGAIGDYLNPPRAAQYFRGSWCFSWLEQPIVFVAVWWRAYRVVDTSRDRR